MRKVVVFIAMSLDGFIADKAGGVDWLSGQDETVETVETYAAFIKDVDTVVMGWKTYEQIVTVLSPDAWPYAGLQTYVVTHRARVEEDGIHFTNTAPDVLVRKLREASGKDIWICGGASVIAPLVQADLVDTYQLSVIPLLLGEGVRLFPQRTHSLPLRLVQSACNNGILEVIYERR